MCYMEELITAIYNFEPVSHVRNLLEQHSFESLFKPDENGLDVIHHAVLASNPEIFPLLQQKGFGVSNSQPFPLVENGSQEEKLGYLHLACLVSNSIVIEALCRLPNCRINVTCSRTCWPNVEVVLRFMQKGRNRFATAETLETCRTAHGKITSGGDIPVSAVDIAALSENLTGLLVVLDISMTNSTLKKLSPLEQAVNANSLLAFQFLLSKGPKSEELESALRYCLSRRLVEHLRSLFDHGVDVDKALRKINPYHIVYLCSTGVQQPRFQNLADLSQRNEGIEEVTSLLIERGFSVNVRFPLGTYPLYSLITALIHEKDSRPSEVPIYHIQTLDLLLGAGADVNFDEVLYQESEDQTSFTGRDFATSALNCYFSCLMSCDTWRPHIMEHLDRLCLTLLESGANAGYVDAWGCSPLHDLMLAMASQHALGHMHADLSTMSRMLLYFGASPDFRCIQDEEHIYPVVYYFTTLLAKMGGRIAFNRWISSSTPAQVLNLLYYMETSAANDASKHIVRLLENAQADGVSENVITVIVSTMKEYTCNLKSLQELSLMTVWRAISRKIRNVKRLNLPKSFFSAFKELFALDI